MKPTSFILVLGLVGAPAWAQTTPDTAETPPTVTAVRLDAPLQVDGRLDEAVYTSTMPVSGFVQSEPQSGAPATERTDVWVSFDQENLYVSVRAWESRPDLMIVNEMRRDSLSLLQNEGFGFFLDTFHDQRNGLLFSFNPAGGRIDGQITNEGSYNGDWNPVWDLAVARFEGGWTAEAVVPFKSLRYGGRGGQTWGFQARRINRWKNEVSYLAPVPTGSGVAGLQRASEAATLTGVEVPPLRNLDVKPFLISDLTTDLSAAPRRRNDLGGDFGLDVKYGLTSSLVADLTYRTDFAQVEADEQQVNLTRFSLFFPEKREFFLENQGIFGFGGAAGRGGVPFLFYSRRIGLDGGLAVPIEGGGRVSGRVGPYAIGLMNVQTDGTDAAAATNFSVARVQRNILRRSQIGAMVTHRSTSSSGAGSSQAFGVDARFAFYQNLTIESYWARTHAETRRGDDDSYRVQFQYNGDRYGVILHRLSVGGDFNPETGFLFRRDFAKYFSQFRFSPRPARSERIRKYTFQGEIDYYENLSGRVETRELTGLFGIEFQNSDEFEVTYSDWFEGIVEPFTISRGVTIASGGYNFEEARAAYTFGRQRPLSGTVFIEGGTFWNGDRRTLGASGARAQLTSQLSVEPGLSINRVELPSGAFTTTLATSRVTYTVTPLMFVSGLVQYSSSSNAVSANVRLRWEYQPGSELFIVYNESRDTLSPRFPDLQNRALIVKINRLFRL
jgi:hypothetical protein